MLDFIKCLIVLAISMPLTAHANVDFTSDIGIEIRLFSETALAEQDDNSFSFHIEPEWYFDGDDSTFSLKPFFRYDSMDNERTHFDIREANWENIGDNWSLNIGINKVFWGVAETQHLVDIINQTDLVENIDGEDKLGQPMINYNLERSWGTISFFVLPVFRERTFPGEDGRLRPSTLIDNDNTQYESSAEKTHTDIAIRYSTYKGAWDFGFSYFQGTSRDPLFVLDPQTSKLIPYYPQITQSSADVQITLGAWLLKLEMIYRSNFGKNHNYIAAVTGFEYTTYSLFDSAVDIGWILEYQYDERDYFKSEPFNTELSDVITGGARLDFNDIKSTSMLLAIGTETDNDTKFISIEGSRRLDSDMKLTIEGRVFTGIDDQQPFATLLYPYRKDDFIQLTLNKYF